MRVFLWGDVEGGLKDSRIETNWGAEFCGRELERADLSKGKGTFMSFFFLSSLHVYQLIQHASKWTFSCGVLGGMTRTYLYHFVLFQLSIHTKLGVDSGFWLWKPWISNFACFPFRLPCVWCRSQKTCWHCRTRNFWDIKPLTKRQRHRWKRPLGPFRPSSNTDSLFTFAQYCSTGQHLERGGSRAISKQF